MTERTVTGERISDAFWDGWFLGCLSGLFLGIFLCWLASVVAA